MPNSDPSSERPERGAVRIRSNVCADPQGWSLVPGELLKRYSWFTPDKATKKQHDEMMYYVPCCVCGRTIFEIHEDGCDERGCRAQGLLSSAEAGKRKRARLAGEESAVDR